MTEWTPTILNSQTLKNDLHRGFRIYRTNKNLTINYFDTYSNVTWLNKTNNIYHKITFNIGVWSRTTFISNHKGKFIYKIGGYFIINKDTKMKIHILSVTYRLECRNSYPPDIFNLI